MIDSLQLLITKYSSRAVIPTSFVILDLQDLIDKQLSRKDDSSLLEDVQATYLAKFGTIPMRYKNDIQWLSSKL